MSNAPKIRFFTDLTEEPETSTEAVQPTHREDVHPLMDAMEHQQATDAPQNAEQREDAIANSVLPTALRLAP